MSTDTTIRTNEVTLWPRLLMCAGTLCTAFFVRFQHLATISFWFDEACSSKISQFRMPDMFDAISRDAHPPLYYLLLKFWAQIFGESVFAARCLSIFFGLLTILAAFWLIVEICGLQRHSSRHDLQAKTCIFWGCLAAVLVAASPHHIRMSQEARPYTLGAFLALICAVFLLRAFERPNGYINWVWFSISAALLSMTHYYCLFTVFALYLFAIGEVVLQWRGSRADSTKNLIKLVVSVWALQLMWLPWMSVFQQQRMRANTQLWMETFQWNDITHACLAVLTGEGFAAKWTHVSPLIAILWVALGFWLLSRAGRGGRLIGICSLVPILCCVTYSLVTRNIVGARYLIFAQCFFLVGITLFAAKRRTLCNSGMVCVAVLMLSALTTWNAVADREDTAGFPGAIGAFAHINRHRRGNEPVVVWSPFVHTISTHYLADRSNVLTFHAGDHHSNILCGPALKYSDYKPLGEIIASMPFRIWFVEAHGLDVVEAEAVVPAGYELLTTKLFAERFYWRMDLEVREFQRVDVVLK